MKNTFSLIAVLLLGGIVGNIVAQQSLYALNRVCWNKTEDWTLNPDFAACVCCSNVYVGERIHLTYQISVLEIQMPLRNGNALTAVTY